VRWVLANAAQLGGDPARVVLMGHSAGAYNAAMLALDPRWLGPQRSQVSGLIGIAGPYDFLPIGKNPETQKAFNWPDTPRDSQVFGHVTPKPHRAPCCWPPAATTWWTHSATRWVWASG
jgi:acetyl esterase/lipase